MMRGFALGVFVAVLFLRVAPCTGETLGPQATSATLPNGLALIVSEQRNLPIVSVRLLLDAGARRDPPEMAGVAYLTADLLTEGTTTRSAQEISEAIDFIGASLDTAAGSDQAALSLRVLTKDLDVGLDLLADVLLRPAFSEAELERRREAVLASIRAARDNPTSVATKAFRRTLFGPEPYGHLAEGTEESVMRIHRAEVRDFYSRHYRPEGSVVVVVGDVSAADARQRLERALGSWSGKSAPFVPATAGTRGPETVRIDKSVTQASVVLGQTGVARNDPDYEALSVMNYILGGGGFSSRLMNSVRTEAGLAYSIRSSFSVSKDPGWFSVVLQTKNASVEEAVRLTRGEIERIRTAEVGDEELADAKSYLTGSFPLRLDSISEIGSFLAQTWFYGLGLDYADVYAERIGAVTKEDVQRVAKQHLRPDELVEVVVADLKHVE